jgi:hypothetical protein
MAAPGTRPTLDELPRCWDERIFVLQRATAEFDLKPTFVSVLWTGLGVARQPFALPVAAAHLGANLRRCQIPPVLPLNPRLPFSVP